MDKGEDWWGCHPDRPGGTSLFAEFGIENGSKCGNPVRICEPAPFSTRDSPFDGSAGPKPLAAWLYPVSISLRHFRLWCQECSSFYFPLWMSSAAARHPLAQAHVPGFLPSVGVMTKKRR